MMDHRAVEAADHTFRWLRQHDSPFGGRTLLTIIQFKYVQCIVILWISTYISTFICCAPQVQ